MGWSPFRKTGLTHHHPPGSFKGYTLVTAGGSPNVFLLDMQGRIAHRWQFEGFRPGYGTLLANGNLLIDGDDREPDPPGTRPPTEPDAPLEERARFLGGHYTVLREVSWEGETLWEYKNLCAHHDYHRYENGNTLLPVNVDLTEELSKAVRGGGPRKRKGPPMIGDDLIEIDGDGKELRRIHIWELLDPRKDPICPLEGRQEWTHTNSVDVNEAGDIVISCRNNSRVCIIDNETGEFRWKYGTPDTTHQHNATWVGKNVQIFDNGMHQRGIPSSKVVEVDPETSEVVWQFRGQPGEQFFSPFISGADRLPNGNVLICEGASGRLFETTRAREIVWEWISPFNSPMGGGPAARMYRAHRYGLDHPAIQGRDLDPSRYLDLNRLHGLME